MKNPKGTGGDVKQFPPVTNGKFRQIPPGTAGNVTQSSQAAGLRRGEGRGTVHESVSVGLFGPRRIVQVRPRR